MLTKHLTLRTINANLASHQRIKYSRPIKELGWICYSCNFLSPEMKLWKQGEIIQTCYRIYFWNIEKTTLKPIVWVHWTYTMSM